jgi:hypothetical protein
VDKDTIKGILAKYSPPLSPSQMDEIAFAIANKSADEIAEISKLIQVPKFKKKSRSSRVTASSRGRTR